MSETPTPIFLKDYRPFDWKIPNIELVFDLDFHRTLLHTTLHLEARPPNTPLPLVLNGEDLTLLELKLNGEILPPERYTRNDQLLTIHDVPPISKLEITTELAPDQNFSMEGLYRSRDMLCTQMEAQGFRKITFFPDRPDVMAVYRTTLRANPEIFPVLLSNGNCVIDHILPDGRRETVWFDPFPKPCYLFAVVAGKLALTSGLHVTPSGRKIELRVYTDLDKADRAEYALDCLKNAMIWDEKTFGLECDLDTYMIVAVDAFNCGAMENKGLNIFSAGCALANPATATDADYARVDSVIAHEYFHNWTGNRVTCRDWFQLTLKEGLTVLRESLYSADRTHPEIQRITEVRDLRNSQFIEDAGPHAHPIRPESYIEIDNFYTATVYEKGAEVIRMMRTLIGERAFHKGIQIYFERHDGTAVTTEDFIAALETASGKDLSLFKHWYAQAGTPEVTVTEAWDNAQKIYTLTFSQSCRPTPETKQKKPFPIPIDFAIFNAETGREIVHQIMCLDKEELTLSFAFPECNQKPIPSVLRNFSAPVNLHFKSTPEDQEFLVLNDTALFNRYETFQSMMLATLRHAIDAPEKGFPPKIQNLWRTLLLRALNKADLPGFSALVLTPPSVTQIATAFAEINYPKIYRVRRDFFQFLCAGLEPELRQIIHDNDTIALPYSPDFESTGKRALCDLAFRAIATQNIAILEDAFERFQTAKSMTEQFNQLALLVDYPSGLTTRALEIFYHKYRADSLLVNKWFAIQISPRTPHLKAVIASLENAPEFDAKNPAKIRALYGSLIYNPSVFHDDFAYNYPFVLDKILKIDAFNPMLATGLFKSAFSQLKQLPQENQKRMREILTPLQADASKISPNLFEILGQIL